MKQDRVSISRATKETDIKASIKLYSSEISHINTGIGFFNHMLEALAKHSLISFDVECKGDLDVDFHHSVEDVGIVLGQLLRDVLYPVNNIERYGDSIVVMDEAAVSCALDLSNRAFLVYENFSEIGKVGEFDVELVEEFFRAFAFNAGITLHLAKMRGKNTHHVIEATFKAVAVALRRALRQNELIGMPSTKGSL